MRDVGQDVPTSCPDEIFRQPNKSKNVTTKPKIVEMKRKGRNSRGTKLFREYMAKQDEKQDLVIKILESGAFGATKDDPYSVSRCMSVINGMVDGALITDDSPLLYLIMALNCITKLTGLRDNSNMAILSSSNILVLLEVPSKKGSKRNKKLKPESRYSSRTESQ
ncbi:hypothetical protein Tco_0707849 [Tanacetum coccineum]